MTTTHQPVSQNNAAPPRPTQAAFKPASSQEVWGGVGLGALCGLGFLLGLGWWLSSSLQATMAGVDLRGSRMADILPFIFPIFLPIAGYFWWAAWRDWQRTRAFMADRQITSGVITHLWIDPPRPPGKRYYVGYQFGQGVSAYQAVQARTYKRLSIGDAVTVEYSAANPLLSCLNWQKSPPNGSHFLETG